MASATESRSLHPALWVAAATVTLASAAAIGAIFGWIPAGKADAPAISVASASAPALLEAPPLETPVMVTPKPQPQPKQNVAAPIKPHKALVKHPVSAKPEPTHTSTASGSDTSPPVTSLPAPRCDDCGTIESITAVETAGEGSGIGVVTGAVLGGVLGHQVGEGNGKRLARIGGAVLGGYAGNEAEKRIRKNTRWDVAVRMNDGSLRHVDMSSQPTWHDGESVRVVDGQIVAPANASL